MLQKAFLPDKKQAFQSAYIPTLALQHKYTLEHRRIRLHT